MAKYIVFHNRARSSLRRGVDTVAGAVRYTLGPRGRNIAIEQRFTGPLVTHDGVTIAKEIDLEDPLDNMAVFLIREVASKTNDVAGDGTTTATVMAQAMMREGLKNLAAGANPMQIKQGLEKGTEKVVEYLRAHAMAVEGKKEIAQLATISAADEGIGQLIADVIEKVTRDGIITVKESQGIHDSVEYVEGMQFDRGFISPAFITDQGKSEAIVENPAILITDRKISALDDLLPVLEKMLQQGKRDLVIIAEDITGEALTTLVVNKSKGILNVVGVRAPSFGDRRKEVMRDIAVLTGGQFISEEIGQQLRNVRLSDLGAAGTVIVHKEDMILIDGKGNKVDIQARMRVVKAQLQVATSDYDREKLEERLAKLVGGVAIIKVGATTELELKYRKTRMEDALAATRSGIEEGILPGGGIALLNAAAALDSLQCSGDVAVGVAILRRVLEEPLRQLAINAGYNGSVVVDNVRRAQQEHNNVNYGYNVLNNRYEDMVEAGIIDSVKVTRSALQNAASIAVMILTTEVLITDIPEKIDSRPLLGEF